MRRATKWITAALIVSAPAYGSAQSPGSTEMFSGDLDAAFELAVAALGTGATVSDRLISLEDLGRYSVAVAVVARPPGTSTSSLSHDSITEIYYVLRGSGTHVTGTMVNGTRGERVSPQVGPTMSSSSPIQNGKSTRLGAGDIQIIPPRVAHGFASIDPGGIEYLVFRIDPDRVLSLPQPAGW
jgi:mannose-6-phosphate isomerase-like protein (cupin superfamily)